MAIEQTVVIAKPDAVKSGWIDPIRSRYLAIGLGVAAEFPIRFREEEVQEFYEEHRGKFFFISLILSITSGDSYVFILEGEDAIAKVRKLNGATDPSEAEPGTIRADFRSAGGPFNTVHGSANAIDAAREIGLMKSWRPPDWNG